MALHGIRVIEMGGTVPVAFCGMMLADFGAEVIRVDPLTRPPDWPDFGLSRWKRSIQLDLKDPKGKRALEELTSKADVLIEGFRPGVLERLGLDPTRLCEERPSLIVARLTGFGQTGPLHKKGGHDVNFLGISGVLDYIGPAGQPPVVPNNFLSSFAGGAFLCALGIVISLYHRQHTGKGQIIDQAMIDGAHYLNTFSLVHSAGFSRGRARNAVDGGAHFFRVYETKDGRYITVGAGEPHFYLNLLRGLGYSESEIAELPSQVDASQWEYMKGELQKKFHQKTLQEWCEIFSSIDACVQPVLDRDDMKSHPHVQARGMFVRQQNGTDVPTPSPRLSAGSRSPSQAPIPTMGQHTRQVLEELAFSTEEINEMLRPVSRL